MLLFFFAVILSHCRLLEFPGQLLCPLDALCDVAVSESPEPIKLDNGSNFTEGKRGQ